MRTTKLILIVMAAVLAASCQRADQVASRAEPAGTAEAKGSAGSGGAPAEAQPPADPSLDAALESLGFQIPTATLRSVDFTLEDLEGRSRSLASYTGKVVFLNFWATWCPPCRAEMPSMESLYRELEGEGLVILAVNSQEPREEVADFVTAGGHTFPVLLDSAGRAGAAYAVRAIPTTYLVSRDGRILGRMTGSRDWHTPETLAVLRRVLEQ